MKMEEWKEYKLGDLLKIKYGKDHKKLGNGDIPVYGSGGIMRTGDAYLSDKPSVLIPRKGTLSNIFYVEKPFWTVDTMFWSEINDNIVIPKYLYYAIKDYKWDSMNVGSAVPSLTVPVIESVSVSIPSIGTQEKIAAQLSEIDDKIAVNRRICENLEAQAQALFKHWFIDFAPFKEEKFVESELGMIPEGWRVGRLEELGDIVGGATPSKAEDSYYTSKGIAWLTPKDLSNKLSKFTSRGEIDLTQEGYNSCSAKLMPKGSVLFSSRAPIGYLTIAKNDICTNQGFKSVVPKYAGTAYIYYLLKTNTKRIESMSSGTTFKEASGSLMKSLAVIIPPKSIIDNYEASVVEIFNEQEVIEQQNLYLATLRDTLLPKLMSGQIKL